MFPLCFRPRTYRVGSRLKKTDRGRASQPDASANARTSASTWGAKPTTRAPVAVASPTAAPRRLRSTSTRSPDPARAPIRPGVVWWTSRMASSMRARSMRSTTMVKTVTQPHPADNDSSPSRVLPREPSSRVRERPGRPRTVRCRLDAMHACCREWRRRCHQELGYRPRSPSMRTTPSAQRRFGVSRTCLRGDTFRLGRAHRMMRTGVESRSGRLRAKSGTDHAQSDRWRARWARAFSAPQMMPGSWSDSSTSLQVMGTNPYSSSGKCSVSKPRRGGGATPAARSTSVG